MDLLISLLLTGGFDGNDNVTNSSSEIGKMANDNLIDVSKINATQSPSKNTSSVSFISKYWYIILILLVIIIVVSIIFIKNKPNNTSSNTITTVQTTTKPAIQSVYMSSVISSNLNSSSNTKNNINNNANNTFIYQDSKVNDVSTSNFTSVKDGVVSNTPTTEDLDAIKKANENAEREKEKALALTQTQIINANLFI